MDADNKCEAIIEDVHIVAAHHPTAPAEGVAVAGKKRASNVWEFYTNDPNPHKSKSSTCKHCLTLFNHHKKSEQAVKHLQNCRTFRFAMNAIQEHDCPDWYYYDSTSSGMNKQRSKKLFSSPTYSDSMTTSPSNLGSNPSIKDYLLPKWSTKAGAQAKFEQCIAMHYYITGILFVCVEEEHLAMAMKILCPADGQLPTRKMMGDSLLKTAVKELKVMDILQIPLFVWQLTDGPISIITIQLSLT